MFFSMSFLNISNNFESKTKKKKNKKLKNMKIMK